MIAATLLACGERSTVDFDGAVINDGGDTDGPITTVDKGPASAGGPVSIPLVGDSGRAKKVIAKLVEGIGGEGVDQVYEWGRGVEASGVVSIGCQPLVHFTGHVSRQRGRHGEQASEALSRCERPQVHRTS